MILYGSRRAQADGEAWPSRPSTCQLVVTNCTPPPWWLGSKSSFSPTIHRTAHQCVNGLAACSIPLAEPSQGDLLRAVPQVTCVTGLRTRENFTLCSTFSKCLRRTRRRGGTTLWSLALRATVSAVYQMVKASFIMSLSGEHILLAKHMIFRLPKRNAIRYTRSCAIWGGSSIRALMLRSDFIFKLGQKHRLKTVILPWACANSSSFCVSESPSSSGNFAMGFFLWLPCLSRYPLQGATT